MKHVFAAAGLLLLSGVVTAQEGYTAKSLFFGEDGNVVATSATQKSPEAKPVLAAKQVTTAKPKKLLAARQIGASYFIRLKNADGSTSDVLANRSFKNGDRFQLGVKVNRPSYVYVLNQDPHGQLAQIFPAGGQDNYVNAMGTVFLPSRGAFEFDATPGTEQLLVFLSPTPMRGGVNELLGKSQPDLEVGLASGGSCAPRMAGAHLLADAGNSGYTSKAITYKEEAECAAPAYTSKAITFSDDPSPGEGGQVASYVVKKTTGKADSKLLLKIKLAHE